MRVRTAVLPRKDGGGIPTQHAALVTDASVDLPAQVTADLGIQIAPLGYDLGGRHYLTSQQEPGEFFAALANSTAKVEGVSADDWEAALRAAGERAEDLICIVQSVGSSFSRVSAEVAVRRLQNDGKRVEIISPGRSTLGLGALCVAAARKAMSGAETSDVFAFLEQESMRSDTFAAPGGLDYLERTGDLAILNSQSNVGAIDFGTPVFRIRGRVSALAPADDTDAAINEMVRRVKDAASGAPVVLVAAGADPAGPVAKLTDAAQQALNVAELHVTSLGPTIGSVLGPGAFALGYCVLQSE